MTPVADNKGPQSRGVVAEGPVGSSWAGRFRRFRYEIHRWQGDLIPDVAAAVGGPVRVTSGEATAQRVLDLVPLVPTPTWGRYVLKAGAMWNSNSVISWLLASAGIDDAAGVPPMRGSAPGWEAGLAAARRPHRTLPNPPARAPRHLVRQIASVVHYVPALLTAPLYRRRHLRWGATSAESRRRTPWRFVRVERAVPGDESNHDRCATQVGVAMARAGRLRTRWTLQQRSPRQPLPPQRRRDHSRAAGFGRRALGGDVTQTHRTHRADGPFGRNQLIAAVDHAGYHLGPGR